MKTFFSFVAIGIFSFQVQAQISLTLSSSPGVGSGTWSVVAADVNGDGKLDLISANEYANALSVLTNNGSGGFVLASSPAVGGNPVSVVTADVNGDGRLDLICANSSSSTLSVLTNNGSGGFVTAGTYAVGSGPRLVVAADINGDGKPDLICANYGSSTLSVLTNNGSGGFVLASSLNVGSGPWSVAVADVNGDGKLDLISANYNANTLSVLTNNGSGGFVLASSPSVGSHPLSVTSADVNGDGKPDLICVNQYDHTLSVLTNDGSGSFVTAGTYATGNNPGLVTAADINGDGWLDLICANQADNTLSIFTNNGNGSFLLAALPGVGSNPLPVVAADVNGDGRLDLISGNHNDSTLSILTNATPFPPTSLPIITSQPNGITNLVGATTSFSVGVTAQGTETARQFSYQWQLAGTNLPAGISSSLILTNLTLNQAGNYIVIITNTAGSVTSSPAKLDVRFILVKVNNQPAAGTMTSIGSVTVTISGGYPSGFLFYTLDGSTPTPSSTLYGSPITLTNSAVVSVMALSADFTQTNFASPVAVQVTPVYNLQTSIIGSGTLSTNPISGPYLSNSVVTLTATPVLNWGFDHWAGDAMGSQNPLNVIMNGPRNVQAVFVQTAFPLTLTTPGGGGVTANAVPISPGTYYPTGSAVTLAATASNGWSFISWQGSTNSTNNPLNLAIFQTNNIQAIFGTAVATNTLGGGNIFLNQTNPVPYGTTLTASAVPNPGQYFVTWSGAVNGTNAPTTITVTNANPTINALFTTLPAGKFSLSVVVVGNGSVSNSPRQNYYNLGDNVTFKAATNAGIYFYGWTQDASGTNNPLTVLMNTNKIIQAYFVPLPALTNPPVIISQPTDQTVIVGNAAAFSVTASNTTSLSYQWNFSGTNIFGATNALLVLPNAFPSIAGTYVVIITNAYGSVTSNPALLTVLPPGIIAPTILANGQFQFSFNTATGVNYEVDYSTDLINWFPLLTVGGAGVPLSLIDPNTAESPQRFYRINVLSP